MKINTCKHVFSLSLSLSAVGMAVWIWEDVIVMNSSIDSGHRYHSSLRFQSFIVIWYEGRAASTKYHYTSTSATSGIGHTSHVFIFHSFTPYMIYTLLLAFLSLFHLTHLQHLISFPHSFTSSYFLFVFIHSSPYHLFSSILPASLLSLWL